MKRIETIKVPVPSLSKQKDFVKKIENIETELAELEATIANIPAQKEAILKKYL